jgi:peptidoglycan/LPS O-acetylase OafA/YrhL
MIMETVLIQNHESSQIYEKEFPFFFMLNGYFCVDTFFAMSGLLAAYGILRGLQRSGGKMSIMFPLEMYLHRFLR